jgi:transposase
VSSSAGYRRPCQHHVAGDKVFVDYSGKTVPIVDRQTGEVRPAQLFVAVLGASN